MDTGIAPSQLQSAVRYQPDSIYITLILVVILLTISRLNILRGLANWCDICAASLILFATFCRAVIASGVSTRCPFLKEESIKNWVHFSLLIWICGLAFEGRSVLLISKLLSGVRCREAFPCVLGRIIVVALIITATAYSCCVFGGLYFSYVYQVRSTQLRVLVHCMYMCLLSTEC